jgi:hypothetical protein
VQAVAELVGESEEVLLEVEDRDGGLEVGPLDDGCGLLDQTGQAVL